MPIRSCTMCRKRDEKKNLIRIAKDVNNYAIFDKNQNINSRAIYFCNNTKCIEKFLEIAKKRKININCNIDMKSLEEVLNKII